MLTRTRALMGSAALFALALSGPAATTASARYGGTGGRTERGRMFEGDRFDTMRAMARYLDDGAQFALSRASDRLSSSRDRDERAYLAALRSFARRAADLNNRLYDYQGDPGPLEREVRWLTNSAREVDARMRRVGAMSAVYHDWGMVLDDLGRMQQFAEGRDVTPPPARPEWADRGSYGRYGRYGYGSARAGESRRSSDLGGFRPTILTGRQMSEFRQLLDELDRRVRRTLDMAERNRPAAGDDRTRQVLSDLRAFASRTRSLQDRVRASSVDPREVGPLVERLLVEARATDHSLREGDAFSTTWSEWPGVIDALQRMDDLMRR